jgi:hypothetical protein
MAYNNVYRQLHGEIMGETEKAIKFEFCTATNESELDDGAYKTEWFPLSQISSIHRFSKPDNDLSDILMISEWVLKQKGILHLAGTTAKPVLSGTPTTVIPKIQDKLQHPPVSNWTDMDDDIPF